LRFRPQGKAAVFIGLLCLLSGTAAYSGTLSVVSQSRWVDVERVLDGDTFVSTKGEHIRLLGINAPEVAHEASPAQPMGRAATQALARMIADTTVRLDFDVQRKDHFGRTLAQVYLRNGSWVNGEMVRTGMAHVYTFTPNLHWAGPLISLERPARQAGIGIWHTDRFAMLEAARVTASELGQFRVIHGQVSRISRNGFGFHLGRLGVSIPRKYRQYFRHPPLIKTGDDVVVHGVVRKSSSGLYVALHSPYDMEKL